MNELSMAEMAYYTGRSLSTFKRDFKHYSDLTPQKWLIRPRLHAAHELIRKGGRKVSDICYEVGFGNLSHFSKVYKRYFQGLLRQNMKIELHNKYIWTLQQSASSTFRLILHR